ncbi:MAG: metallophosphoesterase [Saprospiraceae bacterium]
MTDFIGDIHGHAEMLKALLTKMGYEKKNGAFCHSERKVVFVGDYIDRGPAIRETLQIIRAMVDADQALAIMGNHEYNALCFHFQERDGGGHLRKHLIKNIIQHYETLKQFQNRQSEYEEYLDWFLTLPLYIETEQFRAVHACWDINNIDYLDRRLQKGCLNDELIYEAAIHGDPLNIAVEETLKGKEMKMPVGTYFSDKEGTKRTEFRTKWWEDPAAATYRSISVENITTLPDQRIDAKNFRKNHHYGEEEKMVFFGHYWLSGPPYFFRHNVCCLDYSVAKNGHLVSYRLGDEKILDKNNLVYV